MYLTTESLMTAHTNILCFRGGFLLYHDHKNSETKAYDFRETAPDAVDENILMGSNRVRYC